jgi:hypothetical protein
LEEGTGGMSDIHIHMNDAVKIEPGDRLLLTTPDTMEPEQAKQMRDALVDRFPDVEFTFVDRVSGVAVEKNNQNKQEGEDHG